jgi:TetR/AcrR family transcriptional regulator
LHGQFSRKFKQIGTPVAGKPAPLSKRPQRKTRDADVAQETILRVAREHFVSHGLAGARMDEIAAASGYSKAMIYHYFGSKDALYIAVLDRTYRRDIAPRRPIDVAKVGAIAALTQFVREGAESIRKDPSSLNLLSIENIHKAEYLRRTNLPGTTYANLKKQLKDILDEGERSGAFRKGIDVTQLYLLLSSLLFHPISNRFTLSVLLGTDVSSDQFMAKYIDSSVEMVVGFCINPTRSGAVPRIEVPAPRAKRSKQGSANVHQS